MTGAAPITPNDDLLAAEYVLGVLPHAERVALARRLTQDEALAARVRFWEAELAPLGEDTQEVAPPATVLAAIEDRLFPMSATPTSGAWHSLAFWRGVAAALGLTLLLVAGFAAMRGSLPGPQQPGAYVAEIAGADKALRLAVLYDAASGTLKLNRVAGAAPAGRDLELWLVRDGAPPLSLGLLPHQAMARLALPEGAAARLTPGAVLAISDEPQGGSPTGQPTGAVLATGSLAPI